MNYIKNDVFVLGTGLSHDGSVCVLKNGKIAVAIEKERISRIKHDGGNDALAIKYCLDEAGITIDDVALIVQHSTNGFFINENSWHKGPRPIPAGSDIPVVSISHHLAHAYYAVGTSPFDDSAVFVLDGAGSHYNDCMDFGNGEIGEKNITDELQHLYIEKDSFYEFKDGRLTTLFKDFSPIGDRMRRRLLYPDLTLHSIGGFYSTASMYCFGDHFDTGKLMGLAPYGKPGVYNVPIFELRDDRIFVIYGDWLDQFKKPALQRGDLYDNFQYYADIAHWVQGETERAIDYLIESRRKLVSTENLCYTGGVALNAVANAILLKKRPFENIYLTPAAGDNGIAIGCAYYGWLEILKEKRVMHNGSSCFGRTYSHEEIQQELSAFIRPGKNNYKIFIDTFFKNLPLFARKNPDIKNRYLIEFTIPDVGNYSALFEEGRLVLAGKKDHHDIADCLLFAEAGTFVRSINNHDHLSQSYKEGKTNLKGDITYFLQSVDLAGLYHRVMELIKENPQYDSLCFERNENVVKVTADLLAQGKVIGWFQDGSEFGPRALGNRSILADPRKKGVKQFINGKIKFREDFRPFAPAVMLEHVSDYFEFSGESPYMILVAQVREEWKDKIPDVVHVDNSSRIQTVTQRSNKKFYQLLKEFRDLTGIPILLNTSFNKKGMPIIEKPGEALAFFFECELDCLVMNDFIVYKQKQPVEKNEDRLYVKASGSI